MIVDCIDWADDKNRREGDVIYIEGDTVALRDAFQSIIQLLDAHDQCERERVGKIAARSVMCPLCLRWNDPLNEWHGDGEGHACYGLLDQRKALVQAEFPEV
jgi:hypothetical protein